MRLLDSVRSRVIVLLDTSALEEHSFPTHLMVSPVIFALLDTTALRVPSHPSRARPGTTSTQPDPKPSTTANSVFKVRDKTPISDI